MIEGLKPYAEYNGSGISWAPAIPSSWRTERAKRLFTKMQRPVRPQDDVVTCFRDGMVTLRKNRRLRGFTEATAFSGYQGIRKGDLVVHGMDAFAGAIGVSDSDGKGTPVYNVCKPGPGVVANYYAHTVREMSRAQWILALAKGIRERSTDFRYEMFGNQFVPLPPPDEQAAIVRFLDHANRKIDGFIRAKRKLIGLLNEQKQAIIHRAVTRGLHPDVPLKPSGIPWLGDMPKHWDVLRAKFLFRPIDVRSKTGEEELLTVSSSDGVVLRSSRTITMFKAESYVGHKLCWPNDLVVNSLWAWARGLGFSKYHGIVSTAYGVYRLRPPFQTRWTYFNELLRSSAYDWEFHVRSRGIWKSRLQLSDSSFFDLSVVIPPEVEALKIVHHIVSSTSELNMAIARTEREIALMQEYRTRLTADLVTGKLDVREAAANLPATIDAGNEEEHSNEISEESEEEILES